MGAGAGKKSDASSGAQATATASATASTTTASTKSTTAGDGGSKASDVSNRGEMLLPKNAKNPEAANRRDSTYLSERSQKRWTSKADGVLWGKLASLDKDEIGDIYLQGEVFSMGRDGVLCTYQIVNKLVSSYHVELKAEQYGKSVRVIFVNDHSTNGTFLDGVRVGAGNNVVLGEGSKLSLPWFSASGVEKVVSFRYEPIKVVPDDWEPVLNKYSFGTITFEGTFTTYQLLMPKASGGDATDKEILTAKIINMGQMQHAFSSKSAGDMVKKEVNLLSRLKHPNIAELRESFVGQEYSFLVFKYPKLSPDRAYDLSELVQAQWELAGRILRGRRKLTNQAEEPSLLSEGLVRELVKQLVTVVKYIHSQDISHRNVSPENCLLDYDVSPDGPGASAGVTLKLSNFGFASSFADNVAMQTKIETGHIDFCAPEMILHESGYGKEVDLWAVGVLTMMLLGGGRPPFRKESLGNNFVSPSTSTAASPSSTSPISRANHGLESGLSTAAVIENITLAKFDFVPVALWSEETRSESCKNFVRSLLVADPRARASASDLLKGVHSTWLSES